jgi:hypothetical protein
MTRISKPVPVPKPHPQSRAATPEDVEGRPPPYVKFGVTENVQVHRGFGLTIIRKEYLDYGEWMYDIVPSSTAQRFAPSSTLTDRPTR